MKAEKDIEEERKRYKEIEERKEKEERKGNK